VNEKIVCYKKVVYAGPKYFDTLKSEPGPIRPEKLGPTYNSATCFVKSFILRVLRA